MTDAYVIFRFVFTLALCVLFSYHKKWLSYLSHAISPYLHGNLKNCTSAFYLMFCCTVLPRILNKLLLLMNRGISSICICQSYFMLFLCNFTSHVFVSSRYITWLIFAFSLPMWDIQSPLWHNIYRLCWTFEIIKTLKIISRLYIEMRLI